ncbi:hypothetical protein O3P69_008486 [Scylla paramamosain]|uniref:Uncharacterized protein n=1 Tax=Scylla paramamosain TaxID=85552 RepID=A0AAW0SK63_SCYPA
MDAMDALPYCWESGRHGAKQYYKHRSIITTQVTPTLSVLGRVTECVTLDGRAGGPAQLGVTPCASQPGEGGTTVVTCTFTIRWHITLATPHAVTLDCWVSSEGSTTTALVKIATSVRMARLEFANKETNEICSSRSTPVSLTWVE